MSDYGDNTDRVFNELLATEDLYASALRTMVTIYARPLQKLSILSTEEKEAIFSNTEQLLMCAEALKDALRKDGDVELVWANAFVTTAPYFKLYGAYCRNYTVALATVSKCRQQRDGFGAFLASAQAQKESKGLLLEDFLIKPVQRLLKYPLFFEQFLKTVPAEHEHLPLLKKAQQLVLEGAQYVNKEQVQDSGTSMMHSVLEALGSAYLRLLAPHRKLFLKFKCVYTSVARSIAAMGFLMTDLLLVCERVKGGGLKPWGLYPLRDLLTDDEALDGNPLVLIAEPVSDFTIPMRLEGGGELSGGSAIQGLAGMTLSSQRSGGSSLGSSRSLLQRRDSAADRSVGGGGGGGGDASGANSSSGASSCGSLPVGKSKSSVGNNSARSFSSELEDESFRIELPSAAALDEVRSGLESRQEALRAQEADARKPERRLTSVYLDEAVRDLCVSLAHVRLEATLQAERRGSSGRKSLGSSRFLFRSLSGEAPAASKEELRRSMTPGSNGDALFGGSPASPESSQVATGRMSMRFDEASEMSTPRLSTRSKTSGRSSLRVNVPAAPGSGNSLVARGEASARPADSPHGTQGFEKFQ